MAWGPYMFPQLPPSSYKLSKNTNNSNNDNNNNNNSNNNNSIQFNTQLRRRHTYPR